MQLFDALNVIDATLNHWCGEVAAQDCTCQGIGIQESRSFYSYWMWTQGKATHSTANIVDGYFLEGIKLPTWINLRTLTKAQLQRSMPKDHRIIESANAKPNGGVTTELELLLWREANALKAARCRLPLNMSDQGGTSSMGQTRKKGIHTLKTRCPNYRLSRLHLWKGLGQKLYIYIYLPGPTINIHRPHHPSVTAPVVSPMEDSCGLLSKPGASWNRATLLRKGTWCGDADDICSLFVTFIIAHIWVLWYSIDPKASSTKFNLVFSNDQA